MIHQNGCFIHSGISFKLPNNMSLVLPPESCCEDCIELMARDNSFRLILSFENKMSATPQDLLEDAYSCFEESEVQVTIPVEKCEINGLDVYHTRYTTLYTTAKKESRFTLYDEYVVVSPTDGSTFLNFYFESHSEKENILMDNARDEMLSGLSGKRRE